jgi:hypothetical protein
MLILVRTAKRRRRAVPLSTADGLGRAIPMPAHGVSQKEERKCKDPKRLGKASPGEVREMGKTG